MAYQHSQSHVTPAISHAPPPTRKARIVSRAGQRSDPPRPSRAGAQDLIDEALLRPGRLEVHLEIRPPDAAGRLDILRIHLRRLRNTGRLAPAVWDGLEGLAGAATAGFSGAELAGLVRCAASHALERSLDAAQRAAALGAATGDPDAAGRAAAGMRVEEADMLRALEEVKESRAGPGGWRAWLRRWRGAGRRRAGAMPVL